MPHQASPGNDELLTPAETGHRLKVPVKTLAQWRYLGRGPRFIKMCGQVRYRRSDIDSWIESCVSGAS